MNASRSTEACSVAAARLEEDFAAFFDLVAGLRFAMENDRVHGTPRTDAKLRRCERLVDAALRQHFAYRHLTNRITVR